MGAAHLITVRPMDALKAVHREIDSQTIAGQILPEAATRIAGKVIVLFDELTFAHHRTALAVHVLHDVRDIRRIEEKCIRAHISPANFDLLPKDAA